MFNHYSKEFNQFYMGNASKETYVEMGMEWAPYPKALEFREFMVVEVNGSEAITTRIFGIDDFLSLYPDSKPHIKNNGAFSWKDSRGVWYHVVIEQNDEAFAAAKEMYCNFQNALGEHFEKYLKNEIMPDELKDNDKLFSVIYSKAWADGHSDGYANVVREFECACEFALDVINVYGGSK